VKRNEAQTRHRLLRCVILKNSPVEIVVVCKRNACMDENDMAFVLLGLGRHAGESWDGSSHPL
jgi:hypothetical protein